MDPQDPNAVLFTEPVSEQKVIPSPKLFTDVIQRLWTQPGAISAPIRMDKKIYTMEQNLEELQIPTVDAPLATLANFHHLPIRFGGRVENRGQKGGAFCS